MAEEGGGSSAHFSLLDQVSPRLRGGAASPVESLSDNTAQLITSPIDANSASTFATSEHNNNYGEDPMAVPQSCAFSLNTSAPGGVRNRSASNALQGTSYLPPLGAMQKQSDLRREGHLASAMERDQLEAYLIDQDHSGGDAPPTQVYRRNGESGQSFLHHLHLGWFGVATCLMLLLGGLLCRLLPGMPEDVHRHVGRFLLSSGIFGLASALSNYVAVKVLLLTMFLSRHEGILQASVRDIVVNVFFSKDAIEADVISHVRRSLSTASLTQTVQTIARGERCSKLVESYLDRWLRTPEGLMLAMLGVSKEKLRPLVIPAVISTIADVAPIVSSALSVEDVVSTDTVYSVLERAITNRAEALSIGDLKEIISGVLSPHLALLVLWGSVFGVVVGALTEAFALSQFLSGC